MGPRFGALGVPEPLLPWHVAGVRYLLRVESQAEGGLTSQASEDGAAPAAVGPALNAARAPARPPADVERSEAAEAGQADASQPPETAGQGSDWPEPWGAFLAKTCQPCSALFVYRELGFDLAGQASPERRALFADILGALRNKAGWPRGCVSFWPLGVPAPENPSSLAVDTDMFWRGVAHIKPRFVCLFGRAAWDALYPGRRFIIGPLRASGHSLLVLPGPEEMLPDNKQVKGVVWNSLRSLGISG